MTSLLADTDIKNYTQLFAVGLPLLLAAAVMSLHAGAEANKKLIAQQATSAKKPPQGFQTRQETDSANGLDVQEPKLTCSVTVPTPEPVDLTPVAKISVTDAKAKALSGQPQRQRKRVLNSIMKTAASSTVLS